jgi:protease IV
MTTSTSAAVAAQAAAGKNGAGGAVAGAGGAGGRTTGFASRWIRFSGRVLRNSLVVVVGVATVAVAYNEYTTLYPNLRGRGGGSPGEDEEYGNDEDDQQQQRYSSSRGGSSNNKKKEKVLVIPFHRIQIVAEKDASSSLRRLLSGDPEPVLQYQVDELVDLIHAAASDPNIGALYGIFGQGSSSSINNLGGWADVEEIRNALRVFRESHRRHVEPNLGHCRQVIPRIQSKPLYAYTDSFAADADGGNKQYYLASIFTHIHLQKHGELNLSGLSSTQFFFRGFLERHGIVVHVLKHGAYKTAPNKFTEWGMNRAHLHQVTKMLQQLQHDVCLEITASRSKALFNNSRNRNIDHLWKHIHNSGTFPALTAWKAGLVDYLPRRDPLADLVNANDASSNDSIIDSFIDYYKLQREHHKDKVKAQWDCQETDFDRFTANQVVTLADYQARLQKQKIAKQRHAQWAARKHKVQELLFNTSNNNKINNKTQRQEIALLRVNGNIDNDAARQLVDSIRQVRASSNAGVTKCVVVHVASSGGHKVACETISQELQALDVPVVFSFGNVAASGGYWIAANANRIFCSKKSLTGSIGVFCLRPDLTPLAARYGINVEHVSLGNELAGTYQPFHSLTRKMKNKLALSVSDAYAQFKNVVSQGRGLDLEQVEALAQGQVWTGIEAKMNGLVDEVGGLGRAIAYAKRNFTDYSGEARVVVWPKKTSVVQKLLDAAKKGEAAHCWALLSQEWQFLTSSSGGHFAKNQSVWDDGGVADWLHQAKFPGGSGVMVLAANEDTAIRILLEGAGVRSGTRILPPPSDFWT